MCFLFFFNDPATTEIYTLSLHDALPISAPSRGFPRRAITTAPPCSAALPTMATITAATKRSEEHTSELQSPYDLVCRLLLEKKKKNQKKHNRITQIENHAVIWRPYTRGC